MREAAWLLRVLFSHWRRRPLQLAALLVGLTVATALWSGVQAINGQARESYARAASLFGGGAQDRLTPATGAPITLAAYAALRRAGWPVSPVLEGYVETGGNAYRVIGVEPLTMPPGPIQESFGNGVEIGDFMAPPWQAMAAPGTAQRLGAAAGLPPVTPVQTLAPGVLVMDIGAAEAMLAKPGEISYLLLTRDDRLPAMPPPEAAGVPLQRVPAPGEGDLSRLTDSFHLNLTAFGFLAFCVGLFIVHAAVGMGLEQRLGLYRTLRATGVSARKLAGFVAAELAFLALIAGLVGTGLGALVAQALIGDVAATLRSLYGAAIGETLHLPLSWWLMGLAISLVGAFAAAARSLWRVYRLPVLGAARREAWHGARQREMVLEVSAALLLLALAGALLIWGGSLLSGFAVMGALLFGAALLLPAMLSGLTHLASRLARRPHAQWFWADMRQQIPGLSLAMMALLLALAANVGVGTMVGSFRLTFTEWLDRRLSAELYVDAPSEAAAPRLETLLAAQPGVTAVLGTRRAQTRIDGWPVTVVGRRADHPTYRENWGLLTALPDPWERVAAGDAALVSEQLARKLGLALGDTLSLPAPSGPWEVKVAGFYADYGNPKGQVTVALAEMEARWPGAPRGNYVVRAPPETVPAIMATLAAAFEFGPGDLIDQATLKADALRIFERTFAVTAALNVFTLGVAGIALFAALATLADLRLPSLAPLWAIGVPRRRLAALDLAKTAVLALLTAALAIPFGLALAWVLVEVVNVHAFGWRLPMFLFPGEWVFLTAVTVLIALAAAALPALRLASMAPARLVKLFAEER